MSLFFMVVHLFQVRDIIHFNKTSFGNPLHANILWFQFFFKSRVVNNQKLQDEVKNKVKNVAIQLGIIKTEDEEFMD